MNEASQAQAMTWVYSLFLGFALIAFGGYWISVRVAQPLLEIAVRWARILTISFGATYFVFRLGWSFSETRPIWSIALLFVLGCLLVATIVTWLRIRLFSYEQNPLFPRYSRNEEPEEWPSAPRHILLREWIRKQGFRQVEALLAHPAPDVCIREFHFDSSDGLTRLTVSFMPRNANQLHVSHAASSVTTEGIRYLTDNPFVPNGGCIPENWKLDRKPLIRSLAKLLKLHSGRMEASGKCFVQWEGSPREDIDEQHRLVEKANEKQGMLNPRAKWERCGRFSQEGRYRLWKEILLLNYFGIASP